MQYNDSQSLLYSIIILGNTIIKVAGRDHYQNAVISFKANTNYSIPIINLSNYNLPSREK